MTTYKILIKDLFLDVVWEVFYFPVWWYSRGLKKAAVFCWQMIKNGWRGLAISILLVNFFKPMYAQRGWDAYVLSLTVRFWQLLWRFFVIVFWVVFWVFILFAWLALPIFVIWQIIQGQSL